MENLIKRKRKKLFFNVLYNIPVPIFVYFVLNYFFKVESASFLIALIIFGIKVDIDVNEDVSNERLDELQKKIEELEKKLQEK